MIIRIAMLGSALLLAACQQSQSQSQSPSQETTASPPLAQTQPAQAVAVGERSPVATSVPICTAGDTKTKIPVWQPTVDSQGHVASEPPQNDGQIVYISLVGQGPELVCNDTELNSFGHPDDPNDSSKGGMAINVKGNSHQESGACRFAGYYRNESVPGMHQGWLETYFGAVDAEKLASANTHCLEKAIQ